MNIQPTRDSLYTHFHGDTRMWVITLHDKVLTGKVVYILDSSLETKFGKWSWFALELRAECVYVITVHMRIAKLDDEFASLGISDMRYHVR